MAPVTHIKRDIEGDASPEEFTTPAKVGTAVAVVLVIVGFLIFCWLEWRRRRRISLTLEHEIEVVRESVNSKRLAKRSRRSHHNSRHKRRVSPRTTPSRSPSLAALPSLPDTESKPRSQTRHSRHHPQTKASKPRPISRQNSPHHDTNSISEKSEEEEGSSSSPLEPSKDLSAHRFEHRQTPRRSIEGFFPPRVPLPGRARMRD